MEQATTAVFDSPSTIQSWDQDYYHPKALRFYDDAIQCMLEAMDVESGAHVLDAGCGPGVHSIRVARAGHPVTAVDISASMLEEARTRASRAGFAHCIDFQRQDLTQLDIPDAAFKYAFSWGVVIHIRRIESALTELMRVVEPGGCLALYVTNASCIDYKVEKVVRRFYKPLSLEHDRFGQGCWYELHGERLSLWRLDVKALIAYFREAGWRLRTRRAGELSEFQRRMKGVSRNLLLQANSLAFRWRVPARWAVSNLLVFERRTHS